MQNRWTSIWYLAGRKALSRSRRGWWTGITEAIIATALILLGTILLVSFVTLNVISPLPEETYGWLLNIVVKPLVAMTMIGIGIFMVFNAVFKVAASAERRGAIVSTANQVEILNEFRQRRGDLPNVPSKLNSPLKGQHLPFRITASRQSLWGLLTAGFLCVCFVIIVAVLLVTAYVKLSRGRADWVAGALAIPISFAAMWSFVRFLKQFFKITSIGPTHFELKKYPVIPGTVNQLFISQAGNHRLKLLDVRLVCFEEATFNQGTNTLTERKTVYSRRLFRKRGIQLLPERPFETTFEFLIPNGAMHSFQSSSNRILWQIEVHGQTKGFPAVIRRFEIIVIPHEKQGTTTNLVKRSG
ncbi:MAG: hypothetical protein AAGA30_20065 [Planctomycetota bacterium]